MNNTKDNIGLPTIFLAILGILVGARLLWAKVVYHDARCFFAECRILVNP